jgi:hypothetical protein
MRVVQHDESCSLWWETRQADVDAAIAFTDNSPQNFVELL